MITVTVVINDDSHKDRIAKSVINTNPFFNFIDERINPDEAKKFRRQYGTRMVPFAVVYDGLKPIKGCYGESKKDVIESLIEFLNGNQWRVKE